MATGPVPETMKAVLIAEGRGRITVKDHPVPKIGDDDILVKTVAVSQNPTDYKHVDYVGKPNTILGCDFSGIVVRTGRNVKHPAVGDHVAGITHGGAWPDEGAFAEYVKMPAELVWVVPPNTFSHEQAAAHGVAFLTPIQALFHPNRLGLVEPTTGKNEPKNEWVLVYGGSSAVGLSAIQLLHLAGYKVVATASPHNFELVKSMGADAFFNYRDKDVVRHIKNATGDSLRKAFDTISLKESQAITAESIGPQGGKILLVGAPQEGATDRKDVEMQVTLLYTVMGRAFDFGQMHVPASKEDKQQIVDFYKRLPKLVQDRLVKPLPIKVWPGGLNGVEDGLQYMREGKVSAQKIVYAV